VYVGLNCLKNLCLSLVFRRPPLLFRTTPLEHECADVDEMLLEMSALLFTTLAASSSLISVFLYFESSYCLS